MATAEQMQEALQQQQHELQVLGARMAALETQLQFESARAQTAEQEGSVLIQSMGAMRTDRGGAMVDTKGIGQPFMLKGTSELNFGEWTHKVHTFMLGRFGDHILGALTWASRQRKIVVKGCMIPCLWRRCRRGGPDRRDRRFRCKALRIPCLFHNRRSQQDRSELLENEMAWKLGDDCTASTTRRRP